MDSNSELDEPSPSPPKRKYQKRPAKEWRVCSRCGFEYLTSTPDEDEVLCPYCKKHAYKETPKHILEARETMRIFEKRPKVSTFPHVGYEDDVDPITDDEDETLGDEQKQQGPPPPTHAFVRIKPPPPSPLPAVCSQKEFLFHTNTLSKIIADKWKSLQESQSNSGTPKTPLSDETLGYVVCSAASWLEKHIGFIVDENVDIHQSYLYECPGKNCKETGTRFDILKNHLPACKRFQGDAEVAEKTKEFKKTYLKCPKCNEEPRKLLRHLRIEHMVRAKISKTITTPSRSTRPSPRGKKRKESQNTPRRGKSKTRKASSSSRSKSKSTSSSSSSSLQSRRPGQAHAGEPESKDAELVHVAGTILNASHSEDETPIGSDRVGTASNPQSVAEDEISDEGPV